MLKLAFRNVFRHKLRTGMTLAAIVFSVVGVILSGGFVQDIFHQLGESLIHSQSGHLQISRMGFHAQGSRSPEKYLINDPESVKQTIIKLPGVNDVMARVNFAGLLGNGRSDWPIVGEGVEAEKESKLGTYVRILEGRQLGRDDKYGVLVGEGVARALRLHAGDSVSLLINTTEGALNNLEFEVVGTFQSFSKDYDSRAVRISLVAAHELLNTKGANSIVVSLDRTEDTPRISSVLTQGLDARQFEINTWEKLNDFYQSTVALYKRQFGVLQLIILVLVFLSVANSVNMNILERVGEFGTMMALGNRRGVISQIVLFESALLGSIGAGVGIVAGITLAWLISAIGIPMPPPPNANVGYTAQIRVMPWNVLMAFGVGLCATVLAAVMPALRVSRTPVVHALLQNASNQ